MQALKRYPKHMRSAIAREWAQRSNAEQSAARIARPVDADTLRWRAMHDAKGQLLREGCTYTATTVTRWEARRSVLGSVKQVDLIVNGQFWRRGSMRAVNAAIRWSRWKANLAQYPEKYYLSADARRS